MSATAREITERPCGMPGFSAGDTDEPGSEKISKESEYGGIAGLGGNLKGSIVTGPAVSTGSIALTAASSTTTSPPPPDGGLTAWIQAVMGHLVVFNAWGYISSFGVFQTYYSTTLNRSPSDISWVGSFQIFLLFFIGTLSGRALDAGLFRPVFTAGIILQLLGTFMASLCTTYWQLFLAQGVCTGIGNGLVFCPTVSLVSTYFAKNRSVAIGIAATGSATGGLVFPAIVRQLLPSIGFGWTIRVIGFVQIATSALALSFLKTRLPPRKTGPLIEWAAFKEMTYVLYCLGMWFNLWGLFFAYYYVGAFGRNIIGISYTDSVSILLVMNGLGIPGRIIPNYLADSLFGPLNTLIPLTFSCSLLIFCWSAISSRAGLFAFAAVYGIPSAGIQSLFPATLSSLTTDLNKTGVRMGMGFSIVSFACLSGPPIGGALVQQDGGRYLHAQIWAGLALFCGGVALVGARVAKTGFVLKCKV